MLSKLIRKNALGLPSGKKPPGGLTANLRRTLLSVDYSGWQRQPAFSDRPDRKFVFVGLGSIGKPAVHLLDRFASVDYRNVHLVDQLDMRGEPALQRALQQGATFTQRRLEDGDWEPFFRSLDLKPLDVVIDLTTDTNGPKIVETVRKLSLMYLNSAMEINWHYSSDDVYESSLLRRTHLTQEVHRANPDPHNASHIYDFGMNPGVISHFAIRGLLDVAGHVLAARKDPLLAEYVEKKQYNMIAKHLDLHTIHSSEVDTQIARNWKPDGTFICTWSVMGLLEESCEPAQAGWGTHERSLQKDCVIIGKEGVGFKTHAYKKLHRSYVPNEEFVGMVIPHGEAFSLNRALTAPNYAPTVHYVYRLPLQTKALLEGMSYEELCKVEKYRVLNSREDDLVGEDKVGALLIFPRNPVTGENKPWTYWFGSILGQGSSPLFGPTSMQVVSGVLTATRYLLENNQMGPMFPERLPLDFVLRHTLPHMGKIVSSETEWRPKSTQFTDMSLPDTGIA